MAYTREQILEHMLKEWRASMSGVGFLTGWKSIGRFMGVSDSTAKRFAKKYSMPVLGMPFHRPCALPIELLLWIHLIDIRMKERAKEAGENDPL